VDDRPDYNAFEVARLRHDGVMVDQVTSTDEALRALTHTRYSMVITDMERPENGRDDPQAGLRLLERVQENRFDIPVFFYCSPVAIHTSGATSSPGGPPASPPRRSSCSRDWTSRCPGTRDHDRLPAPYAPPAAARPGVTQWPRTR